MVTATGYYPFGMPMPGRNGIAFQSDWVPGRGFVAGSSYPDYLQVATRPYAPTPDAYRAGKEVELLSGFETATATDELLVEIQAGSGVLSNDYPGGQGSYDMYGAYRYGFNGKENDNEVKGQGNQQDYGMRIYDPRVGRFLSVDPLTKTFPDLTPFQFASNNPISSIDFDGMEGWELSTPQAALKRDVELMMAKLEKRTAASQNAQTKTAVISVHLVRPISDHGEDAVSIQRAKAKAQASTPEAKLAAMLASIKKAPKAEIRATPPRKPANEFEAGAVQGVIMFETAVAAELCPSCFVAAGSMNIYNGAKEGDAGRVFNGTLQLTGGVFSNYGGRPITSGISNLKSPNLVTSVEETFASGGTKIVSTEMLNRFPGSATFGDPNGTFISPTQEINSLFQQGLPRSTIMTKLGITDPNFLKGDLLRIDLSPSALKNLNLRLPSGGESGANSLFTLGGATSGGVSEGVVNGIPKTAPGVSVNLIRQ